MCGCPRPPPQKQPEVRLLSRLHFPAYQQPAPPGEIWQRAPTESPGRADMEARFAIARCKSPPVGRETHRSEMHRLRETIKRHTWLRRAELLYPASSRIPLGVHRVN